MKVNAETCSDAKHAFGCPCQAGGDILPGDERRQPIVEGATYKLTVTGGAFEIGTSAYVYVEDDGTLTYVLTGDDGVRRGYSNVSRVQKLSKPSDETRAERWAQTYIDVAQRRLRARDYSRAIESAQALVLQLHAMALLGREGVDSIPVNEIGPLGRITGLDSPAGAGYDVEADRG